MARQRAEDFAEKWGSRYPGAVACLGSNLRALTAHLQLPAEHRERIRHSNLLERTARAAAE